MTIEVLDCPALRIMAPALVANPLTVVDFGCGGTGIHAGWLQLGQAVRALGVDAIPAEIDRLGAAVPPGADLQYRAAWLGLPPGHPLLPTEQASRSGLASRFLTRSAALEFALLRSGAPQPPFAPPVPERLWGKSQKTTPPVTPPGQLLREAGFERFDYLKIDLDGPDLIILRALAAEGMLQHATAIKVEAQLLPDETPGASTHSAIDALLAPMGFRAHAVEPMRYSSRALPLPFLHRDPSISRRGGRLNWADVLYLREAPPRDPNEAIRRAAITAIFDLPDLAIGALHDALVPDLDRDAAIAALNAQAEARHYYMLSYRKYRGGRDGTAGAYCLPPGAPGTEAASRLLAAGRPLLVVEVIGEAAPHPPLCLPADWKVPMRTMRVAPTALSAALDEAPDLLRFASGSATGAMLSQVLAHPAAVGLLGLETGFRLTYGSEPGLAWLVPTLGSAGFVIADAEFDRRQAPFLTVPGQRYGRCYAGRALFLRDTCSNHAHEAAHAMAPDALCRAATMLISAGLPDWAAELLLCWRQRLPVAVPPLLDLLAAQAQPGVDEPLDYAAWMAAIRDDPDRFLAPT